MERKLTHPEIQQLLGAYALDAVDGAEAEAVELHLRDCPRCRAEVNEHREVAAQLADGGAAPTGVWSRIASSLEEAPPRVELAPVTELRPARRAVSVRVVAALSAAAAVVMGVLGVKVIQDGNRLDELSRPRPTEQLLLAANAALVDPSARRVTLRSTDSRFTADAVMLPDGTGYLIKTDLPDAGDGRVYQLWALVGSAKISAGVLGDRPGLSPFKVDAGLSGLAITRERAPGTDGSPGPPVLVGELRAQSA